MNTDSPLNHNAAEDDVAAGQYRGGPPPSPEESRRRWAAWHQAMELSHAMLMMGLRQKIGPEGDLQAAYRDWYERYQALKWDTNVPPSLLLRALEDVYGRVEKLGLSPVVAGGLAVSYWGHPRSTQDIDLAVLVSDDSRFESGLRQAQLLPVKSGRVVDLGFVRVSQWKVTLAEEHIDCEIDFLISNSSYHQTAIGRAISCEFPGVGRQLRVLSCEDLLIFTAASGRLIDLADIQTLYDLHQRTLDYAYLRGKAAELQLPNQFWLRGSN